MKVTLKVVVTDKGVRVLGQNADRQDIAEAIQETVYDDVRVVEVREVSFEIELPIAPEVTTAAVSVETVPEDVRGALEDEMRKRGIREREHAWGAVMKVLPPGLYRVTRGELGAGSYGIRREE